jgi:hypothetical protein
VAPPAGVERVQVTGSHTGAVHAVLDDGIRFVGDDPDLISEVDASLGLGHDRPATIELRVAEDEAGGGVTVTGWGVTCGYLTRRHLLDALPSLLNQIAAASSSCIALHAGAARSPNGEVVLLPATSGAGKTTLTAGLVRDGWAYASDEAVGVRAGSLVALSYAKPLVLDAASRAALGLLPSDAHNTAPSELAAEVELLNGEIGRVGRVVLPRFERDARLSVEQLAPADAIVGILEHALNLARVGQVGLDTLCQLALEVPVHRLVHPGLEEGVPAIEALVRKG